MYISIYVLFYFSINYLNISLKDANDDASQYHKNNTQNDFKDQCTHQFLFE